MKTNDRVDNLPKIERTRAFTSLSGFRVWLGSVCILVVVFGLQSFYPDVIGPLSNVLPTVTAAAAFVSSVLCIRRYKFGLRHQFEAAWLFFALGLGLWVVAEATWAAYYFFLNIVVPYPSLADLFYIGGYFPIIVGAVLYVDVFKVAMSRRRLAAALGIISISAALAMTFVLPIEFSTRDSAVFVFTDLIYPMLDLALLAVAAFALAIFYGGRLAKWWMLFGSAAAVYVIGDELFLYQTAVGTYYNGGLDDLIFLLGYLTFALAFYAHREEF